MMDDEIRRIYTHVLKLNDDIRDSHMDELAGYPIYTVYTKLEAFYFTAREDHGHISKTGVLYNSSMWP